MAAPNRGLAGLSDGERQELEAWLIDFEQQWDERLLPSRARKLPSGSSWRLPALAEMVKVDLERQWQAGRRASLESYLKQFPELGGPGDVSADLIQAEYEVRKQFGDSAGLDDYARRFPQQADELRRLIAQGGTSLPSSRWRTRPPDEPDTVPAPAPAAPGLPESFGRYKVLRRLGAGGMGSVYLAEDTELGRRVALKIANIDPSHGPEVIERFRREARAAAMLDHPYLCKVHDVGVLGGVHYITMAYVEGRSLADLVEGKGALPSRQVAAIVGKLALAMQEAHDKGVIHRDLKPANVMIKQSGSRREPVIVDFGLARQAHAQDRTLTQADQILGTPFYMAPEQVRGESGPACDIYALGVVLYELLTGTRPFEGPPLSVLAQVLTQPPAPPSAHRPDLDPRLESICLRAMAKEPSGRYATMGELAAALTDFLGTPAAAPPGPTPPEPARVDAAAPPSPTAQAGANTLADQFFKQLAPEGDSAVGRAPEPAVAAAPAPDGRGRRPRRLRSASAAAFAALLMLGVIVYVATDQGRIKIEIEGPKGEVRIDGREVRIEGLGEPITLRAGDHVLTVKRGDVEVQSREFKVRRGDNPILSVAYEPHAEAGTGGAAKRGTTRSPEGPPASPSPGDSKGVVDAVPARLPEGPPGSPLRYLGFSIRAAPETVADIAKYTNIVHVPAYNAHAEEFLDAARRAGLTAILSFIGTRREGAEERLAPLIRKHRDVVAGVEWMNPYTDSYSPKDVAQFGHWLKGGFPGLAYWVSSQDKSTEPRSVPAEVDAIVVNEYEDADPGSVRRKADGCLPDWLSKAGRRPVLLRWVDWQPKPPGLVPRCAPGTMRACVEAAERHRLAGVLFQSIGTPSDAPSPMSGIETNEALLAEIRQLARELGFTASRAGVGITAGPPQLGPGRPQGGAAPPLVSDFEAGDEGWSIRNRDGTLRAGHMVLDREGGHPGACLRGTDHSNSKQWGWHAPPRFLGDQSARFGRLLSFDMKVHPVDRRARSGHNIVLKGGGLEITADGLPRPRENQWMHYAIRLDQQGDWRRSIAAEGASVPATNEDIRRVLGQLTDLWIRGEFSGRRDTGWLDNVVFGAAVDAGGSPTPPAAESIK
jgi:predicted Ser/Thr protein kinase